MGNGFIISRAYRDKKSDMIFFEKVIIIIAFITLVIVGLIGFITEHLLDMEVNLDIQTSYGLVNIINFCKVIFDISVLFIVSVGFVRLVMWLWSLLP